jgi:hypothetical protein
MSKKTGIGNWIIFTERFWTKPKVHRMAELLSRGFETLPGFSGVVSFQNLMRHVTCSALSRVFAVVNEHADEVAEESLDAILSGIGGDNYLDMVADMPGIQAAMEEVGWVVRDTKERTLLFPDYLRYNRLSKGRARRGRPGNPRSKAAQRTRAQRQQRPVTAPPVPPPTAPKTEYTDQVPGISEPEMEPPRTQQLEALMKRIDELRPGGWGKVRHWSYDDKHALLQACATLEKCDDAQWAQWAHFFDWCSRPANQSRFPDETRISAKRGVFLDQLAAYTERARQIWRTDPPKVKRAPIPTAPLPDAADARTPEERLRDWKNQTGDAAA